MDHQWTEGPHGMRRRSKDRQSRIDEAPAVRSASDHREAVVGAEDESLREFVRRLPCAVCLRPTLGGDPCHRRTKRRFGDWVEVEGSVIGNIWPGCHAHHREQHDRGVLTFSRKYGLDLMEVCRVVGAAYLAGHEPETLGAAAMGIGYVDGLELRPGLAEY